MEVVVYGRSNPPCPYCEKMKEVFNKKKIAFEYKDVNDFSEEFSQLNVRTVPQCIVNGDNLGGFDNIMKILKEVKS